MLAYYASIILNSFNCLLCSKLCQHNLSRPTYWVHSNQVPNLWLYSNWMELISTGSCQWLCSLTTFTVFNLFRVSLYIVQVPQLIQQCKCSRLQDGVMEELGTDSIIYAHTMYTHQIVDIHILIWPIISSLYFSNGFIPPQGPELGSVWHSCIKQDVV